MGKNYLPSRDADFNNWFIHFKDVYAIYATGLGFSPADTTQLNNVFNNWQTGYTNHLAAANAALAARQIKADRRQAAEAVIRSFVKRIQSHPSTNNGMRKEFEITVPKEDRTPIPPPKDAPFLELDCSMRGRVIVHVGTMPTNEMFNKFPAGAEFAQIFYRMEGSDWQFAAAASTSPFVHELENITPIVVEYRACYQNPTGQVGPWSETDTAFVQPVQSVAFGAGAQDEAA